MSLLRDEGRLGARFVEADGLDREGLGGGKGVWGWWWW